MRSRWATITGATVAVAQRGEQGVEPANTGVAEPGALLGMTVDLDDRVVDIEQRVPRNRVHDLVHNRVHNRVRTGVAGHRCVEQPGQAGQRDQEPGCDRVELADVTEGERPQERAQRRRGIGPGEDPAHPAVPQHGHVLDRVRTGDHPADQRGDLQPCIRTLVGRDRQVLISQVPQPRGLSQREHRNQTAGRHEIRIIERHRRPTKGVRESHPRGALPG